MKLTVECGKCGAETKIGLSGAIQAIIEAAEHTSVFGGFLCTDCGEAGDEE
ncbi:MAG: hypothetical protein DDT21_02453 [Syntrophomonadaceae bacterium]|nr:hypothetical protein [Bacillota bacterium]